MLSASKSQHGIWKIEFNEVLVNSVGDVSSSDVISVIRPRQTVLVALILSNNKSVPLQLVSKVAIRFQEFQVLFHTDSAQVFKKVPVDLRGSLEEFDMEMIVGHKIGTRKGFSALYVQPVAWWKGCDGIRVFIAVLLHI